MTIEQKRPLAIYYEHPDWFRPLFAELDRRGVPYERIHAARHQFDPAAREPTHDVVFNRLSPSAYLRGNAHAIFYTHEYLAHLERQGVRVINGTRAWSTETSKAKQLALLQAAGLPCPRTRVINHIAEAPAAAEGFRFPIVIKPNIGGSGAGVRRFDSIESLAAAAASGATDLGIDHTALVQEFIPQAAGRIVRVEVLNGRYLYAIRIYTTGETFNLCPGDVCQSVDGAELERAACPIDAPRNGLRVESYTPPREIIEAVERITQEASIEIGGVEYFIDDRDGQLYFYDINALSNFVAEPVRVLGFDPFARLVDWLEDEIARAGALVQEVA
jgi:RimK-like ATP-grasp domain